ncbi:uncharacterized protein LOC143853171 [Tasmannia lanceolata]|uniref:uncharacterized protein LOC143853171 n=1 Tax=Tasmannia lanceolata TaxID=3420 RepID=UPI0040627EF6
MDPYANMVCIKCRQGVDDNLLLLCDICDSCAHTYCVGLGREVPEGNWYCEGCRFFDSRSPISLDLDYFADQSASNIGLGMDHSTGGIGVESPPPIDLLEQSYFHKMDTFISSRNFVGEDLQAASLLSRAPTSTGSGRRMLRYRIHPLLSNSMMRQFSEMQFSEISNPIDGPPHSSSESDVDVSEVDQDLTASEHATTLETGESYSSSVEGGHQGNYISPAILGASLLCAVPNEGAVCARKQVIHDPNIASSSGLADETCADLEGINPSNTVLDYEQCKLPVSGTSGNISPCPRNETCSFRKVEGAKEQVRTMVESHLKRLSRDTELDHATFKEIARHSTHSILAACGIEHNQCVTMLVQPPSDCFHIEKDDKLANLMKGFCECCFNSFVRNVVVQIMKTDLQ